MRRGVAAAPGNAMKLTAAALIVALWLVAGLAPAQSAPVRSGGSFLGEVVAAFDHMLASADPAPAPQRHPFHIGPLLPGEPFTVGFVDGGFVARPGSPTAHADILGLASPDYCLTSDDLVPEANVTRSCTGRLSNSTGLGNNTGLPKQILLGGVFAAIGNTTDAWTELNYTRDGAPVGSFTLHCRFDNSTLMLGVRVVGSGYCDAVQITGLIKPTDRWELRGAIADFFLGVVVHAGA